jgi:hypothetical protein
MVYILCKKLLPILEFVAKIAAGRSRSYLLLVAFSMEPRVKAFIEPQFPAFARLRRVGNKQHPSGIEKVERIAVRISMKPPSLCLQPG